MDVQNATAQNNESKEREVLTIDIEPEPFSGIASTKYITSSKLCKMATDLFKGVFADCEGSTFDVINNVPTLAVIFNHGVYDTSKVRVGCSREATVDANSNILQRYRSRDQFLANGDKFLLTEDGKDVFRDLLMYQAYNNGKPNWAKVVSEFSENTQRGFYGFGQVPQYTKVGYIDLGKFASMIWGKKDENGDEVQYSMNIVRALNSGVPGMPPTNFLLMVTKVSSKELQATLDTLGLGSYSNIIR